MKKILINSEYITLSQFLKMEGFIGSGGEAKYFLQENPLFLNDEFENRRGKKLYSNDVIKFQDQVFVIVNEN
ncbi:S4 domain-containing protein YaaA [Gemella cuniculi]|uniref:S4 domain-containing protein YaaA n=1 Tax=Gemella cuniculi TaxID=150240 RepID=UPI00041AD852|nr:S4 domain-containing protein YaaA [Gemella cuniculi]